MKKTRQELEDAMPGYAAALKEVLPDGAVFCLLVFTTDEKGQDYTAYVANGERKSVVEAVREFVHIARSDA